MPAGLGFGNNNGLAMARLAQNDRGTRDPPSTASEATALRDRNPTPATGRPLKRRRGSSGLSGMQSENAPRATGRSINLHKTPAIEGPPRTGSFIPMFSSEINPNVHVHQRNWRARRLLQETRESVSFFSVTSEKFAFSVIFRADLEQSFVSESAVSFLKLQPMDLPVERRPLLSNPSGQIQPERYVRVVVQQVRINNGGPRTEIGDMLVVNDQHFPPGVCAILRGNFFDRNEAGHLPATATPQASSQRQPYRPSFQNSVRSNTATSEFTSDSIADTVPTSVNHSIFDVDSGTTPSYVPYDIHQETGMPVASHPDASQGYMADAVSPLSRHLVQSMQPQLWHQNLAMGNFPPPGNQIFMIPGATRPRNSPYGPAGSPRWPSLNENPQHYQYQQYH
ncbi:hypothetical protein QBC41DRAFT_356952 [Cercophora samala]|uniref:Uncharacterized protein n=1 Tax=Cercophora samala TaxID=330535 RepID=A0AA40DBV8_9PEZI|nr:hypothetical protein QBC41DRAFT_356952 [Cercophora samala]